MASYIEKEDTNYFPITLSTNLKWYLLWIIPLRNYVYFNLKEDLFRIFLIYSKLEVTILLKIELTYFFDRST